MTRNGGLSSVKRKLEEIHEIASCMVGDYHAENIAATAASALRLLEQASTDHECEWELTAETQDRQIERLRALVPAWQPIETAPKDGTPIVALTRDGLAVVIARHLIDDDTSAWCTAHDDAIPSSWHDGICWAENADGEESDPPVLWTPLPNPPEEKK